MVVVDSSVLIVLAKIGELDLLRELFGRALVSPGVGFEVIERGREVSAPEVGVISSAVQEGWLQLVRLSAEEREFSERLLSTTSLGLGEAESIAIARSRQLALVLDDKEARLVAGATGLDYFGTAGMLLQGLLSRKLTLEDLERALKDLVGVMWLAPDVVTEIMRRARLVAE